MCEIFLLWFVSKKFAEAASHKGRSPTLFVLLFLGCWFGFALAAIISTMNSMGARGSDIGVEDWLRIVAAEWVGGLLGMIVSFVILAIVPAVKTESYYDKVHGALDDLRKRKKRWRPPVRTGDKPGPDTADEAEPAQRRADRDDDDAKDDEPETAISSGSKRRRSSARDEDDRDDDDDDYPRRRRRSRRDRDDEDEYEDDEERAPARSSGLLVALIIVGVLLLVGGGIGLTLYLVNSSSSDDGDGGERAGGGGGGGGGQVQLPPPANLDEALEAVRSPQMARRAQGANFIADAAPAADRKREVAAALERLLDDPATDTVEASARALMKWGSTDNVPALARRASAPSLPGRSVIDALGELKDPRGAAAVARWLPNATYRLAAEQALAKIGPAAEPEVKRYALHPNNDAREAAMRLLRGYGKGDPDLFDVALAQLRSDKPADLGADFTDGAAAAEWFAQAKPNDARRPEVLQALEPLLTDGNFRVCNSGAKAYAKWATQDQAMTLTTFLTDHADNYVYSDSCTAIINALARDPDDRGIEAITRCLGKEKLRLPAQTALKTIGGEKAGPIVARFAFDPSMGAAAKDVLRDLGDHPEYLIRGAVSALDGAGRVRDDALEHLLRSEVVPSCRDEVAKALNRLMDSPKGFDDREKGIKLAEKWGTKDNVPALIKMLELPLPGDNNRRRLAMVALVAIKDERAIWPIALRLKNRDDSPHALAALQIMGSATVEAVALKKVEDSDNQTRADAWALLSGFGSKDNYEALKAIADKETNPVVKRGATTALAAIKKR